VPIALPDGAEAVDVRSRRSVCAGAGNTDSVRVRAGAIGLASHIDAVVASAAWSWPPATRDGWPAVTSGMLDC
jgi:hypothetical protein